MNRIPQIEKKEATAPVATAYEAVQAKMGLVPNMVKALGNSNAALQAYLGLSGAVSGGSIKPSTREKIALLVAERNECDYCLSAHTAIGGMMKIPSEELLDARRGEASDAKEAALLKLTESILDNQGAVPETDFLKATARGVTSEEATELVAHITVNIFTNYFNRLAETEIDFPRAEVLADLVS